MQIRPYQPDDAEPLMAIFRMHVPGAFGEDEVDEYAEFLRTNVDPYIVAEHEGRVVGACGHYFTSNDQTARICWILSDPDTKGLGTGGTLLRHNLDVINQNPNVRRIECSTSQVAYRFFEKFGFVLQHTKPDFWAPGLDLYVMALTHE